MPHLPKSTVVDTKATDGSQIQELLREADQVLTEDALGNIASQPIHRGNAVWSDEIRAGTQAVNLFYITSEDLRAVEDASPLQVHGAVVVGDPSRASPTKTG